MIACFRFLFVFTVAAVFLACSEDSSVSDPAFPDTPKSFTGLRLSEYVYDTDSIDVQAGRDKSPADRITLNIRVEAEADSAVQDGPPVVSARCAITQDGKDRTLAEAELQRDSSGSFGGVVRLGIARGDVGDYRLTVRGFDARGNASLPIHTKLRVLAGGRPPYFCGLTAPDTVDLPDDGFILILIEACVADSSGAGDIKRVLFNSFLPSGTPSSGNPFFMFDDGSHGDRIAGDGIYSLNIQLPSTAQKGRYRFEFFAYDLGNLNAFLSHTITVR